MSKWMTAHLIVCMVLALFAGCSRKDAEPEPAENPSPTVDEQPAPLAVLGNALGELDAAGNTNGIIERLDAAMLDPNLEADHPTVARWLIGYLLRIERVSDARSRFESYLATAPASAMAALDLFAQYYQRTEGDGELVALCDAVLALDPEGKVTAWRILASALARQGKLADLVARMPAILELTDADATQVLSGAVSQGLAENAYEGLSGLLESIGQPGDDFPQLAKLVLLTRVDILLQQGDLAQAETFLIANAAALSDGDLSSRLTRLMRDAAKADDDARLDRIARLVLDTIRDKTRTREQVSRIWVRRAVDKGDASTFLSRVEVLVGANLSSSRIASVFQDGFYLVMKSQDADMIAACTVLGERILKLEGLSDYDREAMMMRQLDSAFYRQNFKDALAVLERGIPNQDEDWHKNLINKVSAHLALKEGRHEDAITLFQEHMETVSAWKEPVRNPENGNMMIKEAVLGFNEKRIGDIYASMEGRTDDAGAAYGRAREWYEKALEALEEDSPEHAEATRELALVPKAN